MKVLVICDDIWHPGEVIARGLKPLEKKGYELDVVMAAKDILTKDMLYEYEVIINCKTNSHSPGNASAPWFESGVTAVMPEDFREYVEAGNQVVHISLSSELSSSYQNACIAAETTGDVYVVDSRSLSTGSGHLVILAAELALAGLSAGEVASALDDMKKQLDVSFVLQTLEYLHKGGRCSGVAAFGANVLKLRPEIQVADGKMGVGRKYRGNAEKSILDYVRGRLEGRTDIRHDRIFVTHSGVEPEIVEKVKALVKELQPFDQVIETKAGCTISSHCGPGCLGVLFFRSV